MTEVPDEDALTRRLAAHYRRPGKPSPTGRARLHRALERRRARVRGVRWLGLLAAGLIVWFGRGYLPSPHAPASPRPEEWASRSQLVHLGVDAPQAAQVSVVGAFNDWSPAATPLTRAAGEGRWGIALALPPGRHAYAFVVDGQRWVIDAQAPQTADAFGVTNAVVVPGGP